MPARKALLVELREGNPSDQSLVELVQTGDRDAWRQILARHKRRMSYVAKAVLGSHFPNDAEDIVQDASFNAFAKIGTFRGEAKFSTWLCTITAHTAIDFLRKHRSEVGIQEDISSFDENDGLVKPVIVAETRANAHELLALSDLQRSVDNLIEDYSKEDREIVGLLVDGCSPAEIAYETGSDIQRVYRVTRRFRNRASRAAMFLEFFDKKEP
jgi:RNA polymerase sigma factor (sigma-70 family)